MSDLWGDYYGRAIPEYQTETQNLAHSEDEGRRRAIGLLGGTLAEPGFDYISDDDIPNLYGSGADESSAARRGGYRAAQQMLGQRGITGGGYALAQGRRLEAEHLGNLRTLKRGAVQYQREFNANQGMRRLQGQQVIGGLLAQGKSDAYAQGLTNVLGLQVTREGLQRASEQAQMAANATKEAGKKNFLGQIIGGGFGLLGGAFG